MSYKRKYTKKSRWVMSIVERSGLSQAEFARTHNIPYRTVQDWFLGHKVPSGPSEAFLKKVEEELNES